QLTLSFGKPEAAGEYLKRLFALGFQVKDGLIYLPGQYGDVPPPLSVRAELQQGLTLTFLQHGQTRKLGAESTIQIDPTGEGVAVVVVRYKACEKYKHQSGWQDMVDKKGRLVSQSITVEGPLYPGAVVRHNAFSAATKTEDPVPRLLPLYFALVGCLSLSINR